MIHPQKREAPRCEGVWIIGSRFTEYKWKMNSESQSNSWA